VALVGLGGEILSRRQRAMDAESPAAVVEVMDELAGSLTAPAGGPARRLVGLGVAVPGVVRVSDGNVRFAPNLEWRDEPLGELIAERFGPLPSWVGNDGDLGVLAEHRRGVGRGVQDAVFVQGEVGIGGGLVIGGRALAGAGGYAGELGHMVVRPGGRRCHCGARGCWETEIGTAAVARAIGLDGSPREELTARLNSGDPGLPSALEDLASYLAIGLANIVNLLNPELIVLGGMLQHVYPLVAEQVDAAVRGTALRAPAEQVTLAVPGLGGDSVLLGAAELAWQDMLSDPVGVLGRR
jgi:predicted NBD/HSP70 family sugar kinase